MTSNIRRTMHPAETTKDEDIEFLISIKNSFFYLLSIFGELFVGVAKNWLGIKIVFNKCEDKPNKYDKGSCLMVEFED